MTEEKKVGTFRKVRKTIGSLIAGGLDAETKQMWDRLHEETRLVPVLNRTDLQMRRDEILRIQNKIKTERGSISKGEIVDDVYNLFFTTGDPWYRGLNNRELAKKVATFLWLYNEIRDLPAFLDDLHMCAMQLLSLSWQEMDVTNTPWLIVESPVLDRSSERIDLSGSGAERTRTEEG